MKSLVLAFLVVIPAGNLLPAHAQTATPAQLDRYRTQITQALFIDNPLPPLDPQAFGSSNPTKDIRIERVSFATQYGMRIPAIIYIPTHIKTQAPAMVIVAGHGGDKTSWYEIYAGLLYARAGAIVLSYDPIGEGERNLTRASETRSHDAPIPGLDPPARIGGLMIEDVLQALRYIAQRKDVDSTRIALLGYSMGTFHAALASAITETPVRALVLSAGGNLDGPDEYWDSGNKINCQSGPYKQLLFLEDRGATLYALRSQSGPTLIMNGEQDGLITKFNAQEPWFDDLRQRIFALTGSRINLPETVFYPNAGHRPSWVDRDAVLWLNRQLLFPNWADATIKAFPTIAAHAWATHTNTHIATAYDNDLQEGGVPAIDVRLPGIPRAQLQAIPDAEWQQHRDQYTLEGWIAHAVTPATPTQ
jgi:pimeloyl-ACP methyl ester carboxylesterase